MIEPEGLNQIERFPKSLPQLLVFQYSSGDHPFVGVGLAGDQDRQANGLNGYTWCPSA